MNFWAGNRFSWVVLSQGRQFWNEKLQSQVGKLRPLPQSGRGRFFVEVPDCRIVREFQCPTTWNINATFRLRGVARV